MPASLDDRVPADYPLRFIRRMVNQALSAMSPLRANLCAEWGHIFTFSRNRDRLLCREVAEVFIEHVPGRAESRRLLSCEHFLCRHPRRPVEQPIGWMKGWGGLRRLRHPGIPGLRPSSPEVTLPSTCCAYESSGWSRFRYEPKGETSNEETESLLGGNTPSSLHRSSPQPPLYLPGRDLSLVVQAPYSLEMNL